MPTISSVMTPASDSYRKQGGRWLRALRDRRGLSQKDFAALVNVQNSVFISQLENGRVRIPPEHYEVWAAAYGLPLFEFVKALMSFYDPVTYRLLFQIFDESNRTIGDFPEVVTDPDMRTAVISNQVGDRYIDALYLLLGKKTAELAILEAELDSAGVAKLKRI